MVEDLQCARMGRLADLWRWQTHNGKECIETLRGTKYSFCVQYIVPRWVYMALWVVAIVLQTALAILMTHRKMGRRFPAFYAYTIYEAVLNAFLFAIDHMVSLVSDDAFANAYMVGAVGSAALRFAVACEIFIQVFRGYPRLKELGLVVFRWATAILMIVAVLIVAYSTGLEKDKFTIGFLIVDRAVNIMQCGLLVFLVLLASFLHFSWTNYIMGITLGFGIFSSVELCMSALRAQYGMFFAWRTFPVIARVSYIACIGLWIVTVLLPEHRSRKIEPEGVRNVERWNNALEKLLRE
jgi:hypothetical protein